MRKKKIIVRILLLSLLVLGLGMTSTLVFAEKKAIEGQNEADVEFYEPTPPKPDPKPNPKPDPKPRISKILPKTGENQNFLKLTGVGLLFLSMSTFICFKKEGGVNEN